MPARTSLESVLCRLQRLQRVDTQPLNPSHWPLSAMQGIHARQYDAWDLGFVSTDDFGQAEVRYDASFAQIRETLVRNNGTAPEIPIVTGFLARGEGTGVHSQHLPFLHRLDQ